MIKKAQIVGKVARVIKRTDHIHRLSEDSQERDTMSFRLSQVSMDIAESQDRRVEINIQKIIFDEEDCIIVSLRDVTATHKL